MIRSIMDDLPSPSQASATTASTIDELVKAAFWVATSIDAPSVDTVSPSQINLHYPLDGSLVSIRVEGRPGAWGGIGPHGTPEEEAARQARYDEQKALNTPPPPEGGVLAKESKKEEHKKEEHKRSWEK